MVTAPFVRALALGLLAGKVLWIADATAELPFHAIVLDPGADAVVQTAALELQSFWEARGLGTASIYSSLEASLDPVHYAELKKSLGLVHQEVLDRESSAVAPSEAGTLRLSVDSAAPWLKSSGGNHAGESWQVSRQDANLEILGSESRAVLQAVFWLESQWEAGADWFPEELPVDRQARFDFRVGMPYFTEAGAITDEYLRFMAKSGYNGIYLAFHPYLKYIQDPLFFPISHIFRMRDFVDTADHEQLAAYANDVFERASKYGLDGYLYVMEPWGGDKDFLAAHPEAEGKYRQPRLAPPLCLDQPVVRQHLEDVAAELARNIPKLDGLFIMNEDGTTICDETCPNSTGTRGERRAQLFTSIGKGLHRERPDIRMAAYTWWWDVEDFTAVIPSLPEGSLVCTRTCTNAPFELGPDWKGSPGDVSLLVDGPGRDFQEAVKLAEGRGVHVVDMLAVSNGHELITLPELPAPDRFVRKLDVLEKAGGAGWFTYDCGGVTDNLAAAAMARALWSPAPGTDQVLRELAVANFGEQGAAAALEGWRACSDALGLFPVELDFETFRAGSGTGSNGGAGACAALPAVPLSVEHAEAYAVGGLTGGHRGDFYKNRAVMLKYLRPLAAGLEEGVASLRAAASQAPEPLRRAADLHAGAAEAAACCFRSGIHMLEFLSALDEAPKAADPDSQSALVEEVQRLVAAELANTEVMLRAMQSDPRIFYCACTKYFHPMYLSQGFLNLGYFQEGMSMEEILGKKLKTMRGEDHAAQLSKLFPKP